MNTFSVGVLLVIYVAQLIVEQLVNEQPMADQLWYEQCSDHGGIYGAAQRGEID